MMATILSFLGVAFGFLCGMVWEKRKTIKVTDRFTPNKMRTDEQIKNDAVMQLSNEITKSGALEIVELPNGDLRANLKLIK
jgi:hypothetical protein